MARYSIVSLMQVPEEDHDLDWLKRALQAAITLELATLPPYLCAAWSIDESGTQASRLIQSVFMEEMLHMGLACNMLTTIGGDPKVTGEEFVPKYPGPLPGDVRPELTVYLAGLSKDILQDVFMEIEYPEDGPIARFATEEYRTIGAFYTAIAGAFKKLPPGSITGQRQIAGPLGLFAIKTTEDAEKAIKTIKEQGEGTSQSPKSGDDMAHYYKFAEIFHGRRLIEKDGKWVYEGDAIPFPKVLPVAKEPWGGYPDESRDFDKTYSKLLRELEEAWTTTLNLSPAIGTMYDLEGPARELMKKTLPSGGGNYGPSFLWVA
ncbi:MAG: ferritin-like domain-containing protein [Thermoanaerobaculia bacterium]